jgi:hypothetical protein
MEASRVGGQQPAGAAGPGFGAAVAGQRRVRIDGGGQPATCKAALRLLIRQRPARAHGCASASDFVQSASVRLQCAFSKERPQPEKFAIFLHSRE